MPLSIWQFTAHFPPALNWAWHLHRPWFHDAQGHTL